MKKRYTIGCVIACVVSLSYLPLPAIFDRGSIVPVSLVNENNYYETDLITQQGAHDKRQNPYNNPDLDPEKEQMRGQLRYPPHAIEILRPTLQ